MDVLVDWESISWNEPEEGEERPGYRDKSCVRDGLEVWLVEMTEGYVKDEWCTERHLVYVLEGEASMRFKDGSVIRMRQGDTGVIPASEANPHKMEVSAGERIVGLFFEQP